MEAPKLDGIYASTANPLRLMFMMGTIWKLASFTKATELNILEIGSWCGASALTWGEALSIHTQGKSNLTCIDAWQPFVNLDENPDAISKEMDAALENEEPYEIFKYNMKFLPPDINLTIKRGWSKDTLPTLPANHFDLIYIDGDHSYAGVKSDLELSFPLLKEGGIICGDDLELQAHKIDASLVESQPDLDKYFDEKNNRMYHPGVTQAVGEKFGPVSSWFGYWAMQKKQPEWGKISLEGMPAHIPKNLSSQSLIGLKALLMEHGLI